MNAPTIHGGNASPMTMSSLEIAELVDQRHDNVKRTIETLGAKGVISLPQIEEVKVQRERRAETVQVYNLCKRDSLIVVAQLCPEFTAKLVDRWQDLEEQVAKPTLNPANFSRMQLIELAMQAEQERLLLEHKVEELEPKAKALDRMTLAEGEVCLQTAGKLLQQPPNKFIAWLRSLNTWIFKRQGSSRNSAYTDMLAAEQIRRNLAAKMLVCMAVSTKMRCLPPCVSISPLHRVNGSLRQAAQGRSLPLTRLRGLSHGRLDSKTDARKNDAAKFLRKLTATNTTR